MDTSSLMEQILSKDNLNTAYLQVVRNKGAEGVDGMKYMELKEYLESNGDNIKEQLRVRKYKPQPVRRVEIPKPDGGVRNLGVPTVTDRFVQQAIAQVLTPIYEEQFHDHSYGFRPNRCAQQAIVTALDMMNDGNDWVVDMDLEKFFDTVNHDKLMTLIGKTIKDGDVISIIRKFLVSGIMVEDEYKESVIGTPQGGNLSPLLANIMLNELDKFREFRGIVNYQFEYEFDNGVCIKFKLKQSDFPHLIGLHKLIDIPNFYIIKILQRIDNIKPNKHVIFPPITQLSTISKSVNVEIYNGFVYDINLCACDVY